MRRIVLCSLALVMVGLAGCNTVAGVGKDMSSAGRAVTHSSDDARR
jgi:predicted small secreted protein